MYRTGGGTKTSDTFTLSNACGIIGCGRFCYKDKTTINCNSISMMPASLLDYAHDIECEHKHKHVVFVSAAVSVAQVNHRQSDAIAKGEIFASAETNAKFTRRTTSIYFALALSMASSTCLHLLFGSVALGSTNIHISLNEATMSSANKRSDDA